jgi:predicted acyltransferase
VNAPVGRSLALDAFRGAAVALMILVNNPGSWQHLYPPLAHAPWHGLTPTDLVFPFFLFAVGNALAFVLPAYEAGPPARFWGKVLQRTAGIFAVGLLLNASPFLRWDPVTGELVWRSWETLRWMGVLQRIALCWGAAAVLVWAFGLRGAAWAAGALLVGYWVACVVLGAAADPYSLEGFFGTAIDRAVLGAAHLYRGEGVPFDPEGLASTVPAVAQVLLGVLAGALLRGRSPDHRTVSTLFLWAAAAGVAGYLAHLVMPINKKLWTSSYVLVTTALAMGLLATLVALIDLGGPQRQGRGVLKAGLAAVLPFGRNALFIFVLSGLVPRVLGLLRWPDGHDAEGRPRWITPLPWLYRTVFEPLTPFDPRLASLAMAVVQLAVYWALARWMDRRGLYIRL